MAARGGEQDEKRSGSARLGRETKGSQGKGRRERKDDVSPKRKAFQEEEGCEKFERKLSETEIRVKNLLQQNQGDFSTALTQLENTLKTFLEAEREPEDKSFETDPLLLEVRLQTPTLHFGDLAPIDVILGAEGFPFEFTIQGIPAESEAGRIVAEEAVGYNRALAQVQEEAEKIREDLSVRDRELAKIQMTKTELNQIESQLAQKVLKGRPGLQLKIADLEAKARTDVERREQILLDTVRLQSQIQLHAIELAAQLASARGRIENEVLRYWRSQQQRTVIGTATSQRVCYRQFHRQLQFFRSASASLIKRLNEQISQQISEYYDLQKRLCTRAAPPPPPPVTWSVSHLLLTPQVLSALTEFEQSVVTFLRRDVGERQSFQEFCKLSQPSTVRKLTPWQTFSAFMAQKQAKVLLAAGQTGSGKTYYALAALKAILWARAQADPSTRDEFPSRALIYVPNTIFDQWETQISGMIANPIFFQDDKRQQERFKSVKSAQSGYRTTKWIFTVTNMEDEVVSGFTVVLQALGYSMNPSVRKTISFPATDDLFLVVDEFHKVGFVETLDEGEYSLESGRGDSENTQKRYHDLYYQILEFVDQNMGAQPWNFRTKFLALTATPLTYDRQHEGESIRDSLRVLLPFHLALGDSRIDTNLVNDWKDGPEVKRLVQSWATQWDSKTQTIAQFLQSNLHGFVSYVNYEQCPWMPSYGTDCRNNEICMYVPRGGGTTFEQRPMWRMDSLGVNRTAQPTDFVPILVEARAGKTSLEFKKDRAKERLTEYQLTAKGKIIREFLKQPEFVGQPALIYVPCDAYAPRSPECVKRIVEAVMGEELNGKSSSSIIWFWPSEEGRGSRGSKSTVISKAIIEHNTRAGISRTKMLALYASLVAAKEQNLGEDEYFRLISGALQPGQKAVFIYGRVVSDRLELPPGMRKLEDFANYLKLVQALWMEALTAQSRSSGTKPIQHLFAQLATGLDAAGFKSIFACQPVSPGTPAFQLLGRIARISAAGSNLHGQLRAFQTVVTSKLGTIDHKDPEIKLVEEYYQSRTDAVAVLEESLPKTALDRLWFTPQGTAEVRVPSTQAASPNVPPKYNITQTSANVDAIWNLVSQIDAYKDENEQELRASLIELGNSEEGPVIPPPNQPILSEEMIKVLPEYLELLNTNGRNEVLAVLADLFQVEKKGNDEVLFKPILNALQSTTPVELLEKIRSHRLWLRELHILDEEGQNLDVSEFKDAATFLDVLEDQLEINQGWRAALVLAWAVQNRDLAIIPEINRLVNERKLATPPELITNAQRHTQLELASLSLEDVESLTRSYGHLLTNVLQQFTRSNRCAVTK